VTNHDYSLDFGDKLLAFIRFAFKNHAEFRHNCLGLYAKFSPLWGGSLQGSAKLQKTIEFSNGSKPIHLRGPIVLAAGANKNGKSINAFSNLGLGGITIGTATRNFREGNPHRPRVGLDEFNRMLYNSMGLNNDGIEKISKRVKKQMSEAKKNNFAVGISIAETPGEREQNRMRTLIETFKIAYQTADYVEMNVSCPNTGHSRQDLNTDFMKAAFEEFEKVKKTIAERRAVYAKLSPDLTDNQLLHILELLANLNVEGVILGNTYPSEKLFYCLPVLNAQGTSGGISGRPLYENTFRKTVLAKKHFPQFSIVPCGGIDHGLKVRDLLNEGADFVQVYSAFAFRWMAVAKMNRELFAAIANS
jgi:dihydroorotate dehydrogenase